MAVVGMSTGMGRPARPPLMAARSSSAVPDGERRGPGSTCLVGGPWGGHLPAAV